MAVPADAKPLNLYLAVGDVKSWIGDSVYETDYRIIRAASEWDAYRLIERNREDDFLPWENIRVAKLDPAGPEGFVELFEEATVHAG